MASRPASGSAGQDHRGGEYRPRRNFMKRPRFGNRHRQHGYLQKLVEIGSEHNTTIVFPLPMDLMKAFTRSAGQAKD